MWFWRACEYLFFFPSPEEIGFEGVLGNFGARSTCSLNMLMQKYHSMIVIAVLVLNVFHPGQYLFTRDKILADGPDESKIEPEP